MSAFIDNVAERRKKKRKKITPFEAQGEETGRCRRFAEFETERI
jgi:hypothetical protein